MTEVLEPPRALVRGQPLTELPRDLYIPPDALEVFLEAFEGPMDLLLYLIKRNNLDILDIPMAEITRQYIEYVDLMKALRLDLAAEYLVMAAWLGEFKSRMLLPRHGEESEEEDPRAELVRRLQEYERYKLAAEGLDVLPRLGRDVYPVQAEVSCHESRPLPHVDLRDLLSALRGVLAHAALLTHHQIQREQLSVRERMTQLLGRLAADRFTPFSELFSADEGRQGIVVTFLAILELARASLIELLQAAPFSAIHVRVAAV
jgi:segregation and condensation protein A